MKRFTLAALGAATLICPLVISAGKASAGEVHSQEKNQSQSLAQKGDHELSQSLELRNLEHQQAALNAERRFDLRKDHGHLTTQVSQRLNRRQNEISQAIYRIDHNEVYRPM